MEFSRLSAALIANVLNAQVAAAEHIGILHNVAKLFEIAYDQNGRLWWTE